MVSRVGGYSGDPFKGQSVLTQVDPISPTIFNVMVDAVLWHWFSVVSVTEVSADPGKFNRWRHIFMLMMDYSHQGGQKGCSRHSMS